MFDTDVEIDAAAIQQLVQKGARGIVRAIHQVALALRDEHIPQEAPSGDSGALSDDWQLQQQDPLTWTLTPGSRAFYAHMVARGTVAHGPSRAKAMQLGESRFASWVAGVPANPFDERAKQAADSRAQQFLADALAQEGI